MQELLADFEDLDELYRCYMAFLREGGLFVKSNMRFELGTTVSSRVTLPDALEEDVIQGKVVWVSPQGAQNANPPGVGVAFGENSQPFNDKIIKLLGTSLNSDKPTYTM
ncbi:PilZ domain-containing protein [Pseudoalteromonas xiamenensis]|uniref:PilZ domain-containing protein n=1 Tax=Pseudoalteromonas xiamenensis TaxID=882626 RepID=A0A975DHC4_9GAMM|nr:PilZ domain-containing protein [Pseudoalteromonas xiamenensis]QTH71793.1 PilZ domain-containing protein [Pseudoalteromonas xiamenensis]